MRENEGGIDCAVDGCHVGADPVSGGWRMCAMHYQREVRARAGRTRVGNDVPFPIRPLTAENAARLFDLALASVLEFEGAEVEYQRLVAHLREVGWQHGQAVRREKAVVTRRESRERVRARRRAEQIVFAESPPPERSES